MTSPYGYAGSLRGTCPTSAQTSNWHSETQISSLEVRAATMSRDKSQSTVMFEIHVDTWVYSKDDTMAHAHRLMVIS